jgi:hypothetical protein
LEKKDNLELKSGAHDDFEAIITKSQFGLVGLNEGNINSPIPTLILTLKTKGTSVLDVAFSTGNGWQIVEVVEG